MFIRNLHVESKIKKLLLPHILSLFLKLKTYFFFKFLQLKKIPKLNMGMIHSIDHQ